MITALTGESFVAGRWATGQGARFEASDPAGGKSSGVVFEETSRALVEEAVSGAHSAFQEYALWNADERIDLLVAIADSLDETKDDLVGVAHAESALGLQRLHGELQRTTDQFRKFAEFVEAGWYVEAVIDSANPFATPARPDLRRMLIPVGPIAVFAASNFPLAFGVAGGDTASALAVGSPVVAKAHHSQPGTAELCGRAIQRALKAVGAPSSTFSLLQGPSREVGRSLVRADQIAAVGFTGSLKGGRALYELAAGRERPIPVYAEMGSINPVFITESALSARGPEIVRGLLASLSLGHGQFCTKPGLVFVPAKRAEQLIDAVRAQLEHSEPAPLLNRHIADQFDEQCSTTSGIPGVRTVVTADADDANSQFRSPIVMATDLETLASNSALLEEHFGPALIIVQCSSFVDAAALLPGTLTATLHAEEAELDALIPLRRRLQDIAGRLIWNGYPTGVAVSPAMNHGGPYPATTAPAQTSVGMLAVRRWLRGVAYQDYPDRALPPELQNNNPRQLWRMVNNHWTREPVEQ